MKEAKEIKLKMALYYTFGAILILSIVVSLLFYVSTFVELGALRSWMLLLFICLAAFGVSLALFFCFVPAERLRRKLKRGR
ncbi:MAG: hypothetical protein QMD00_03925 [Hadesarchaea archaeon]|nr:hypothetical protein [Hadesarchaea archaeon]